MTISLFSDERTFEQIKHQLSNMIEVIQVIDYTDIPIHTKEVMYVKLPYYESLENDLNGLTQANRFIIIDQTTDQMLIECINTDTQNNQLIIDLQQSISQEIEVIRGGSVAIASLIKE